MFTPQYQISFILLSRIKQITIIVHELNKLRLPEAVFAQLLGEAQITSTYASTSIEGNPLPLTDVKRVLKLQPEQARQSELEVLNYNRTLQALQAEPPKVFTGQLILDIHQGVMAGLLSDHQTGQWRQEPVVINDPRSGNVVYLPPDHQDVPALIAELEDYVEAQKGTQDPILLAGLFHKQFVVIHPFMDGNGRTARLATQVLLAGMGLNFYSLLSFENYYNQNVTRYFKTVGMYGNYYDLKDALDFTPWLEYFAEGILDELLRLQKQIQSRQTMDTRLQTHHQAILAYIDEHGFITDRDYAKLVDRAKATRALDFRKLIEMGLIERKGVGRKIHYTRT
jgi:Fic family protein